MNKNVLILSLAAALALSLTACGQKTAGGSSAASSRPAAQSSQSASQSAGIGQEGETLDNLPVFPDTVGTLPSETERNAELEKLIAKTWEIPADELSGTSYYYNYTDLNGDGTDELFAVAMGPYTSGTGGDSALIASVGSGGALTLRQTFTLMREPVIVSDTVTNGWHDLITAQYGGGAEACYRVLKADAKGTYPGVGDGESLGDGQDTATLGKVSGTAIVYNDPAADRNAGVLLNLGA